MAITSTLRKDNAQSYDIEDALGLDFGLIASKQEMTKRRLLH